MAETRPAGFCTSSDVFAKAWKSSAPGLDCSHSSALFSAPGGSFDLMKLLQKWDKTVDSASSLFGPSFKADHCSSSAMQLADSFTYTLETQTQGQSSDVGGPGFVGLLHQAMGPSAKLSQKPQTLIRKNQQCSLYNMESENNSVELKPTMLLENVRSIGDGSDLIQSSCSHEETVQKAVDSTLLLPCSVQFNDDRNCSSARSDDSELVSKAEEENACSPKPGASDHDNVLSEFHLLNDEISSSGDFKSGTGGYDSFNCTDMLLDLVEPPNGNDDHMQPAGSVSACNEDRSLNGLCMEAGENKDYWSNIFNMVSSPRSCNHGGVHMSNIF